MSEIKTKSGLIYYLDVNGEIIKIVDGNNGKEI